MSVFFPFPADVIMKVRGEEVGALFAHRWSIFLSREAFERSRGRPQALWSIFSLWFCSSVF